ncbi:MAG: aminotransferase class III-fold pyridoxal phosphate-dependent enzyme [Deltaproteobacteria bacterium]|nr:aminotransferase class III-fold pyridoxal phosphate-dependent enzyme [Deltaproteobacteria bacterium]
MNPVDLSFQLFPGGSLGEFNLTRELSTVLSHGKGSKIYDVFGKEFIDYSISWGSIILGHAHPAIIKAVKKQVVKGSSFSYVTEQALDLAKELNRAIPCAEKIRFAASGTEATFYAIRFARAFSRKTKVVKFEGAYHGAHDIGVTSLFPQSLLPFPKPEPTSAGISRQVQDEILIAPYNDLKTTQQLIEQNEDEIACVIMEPLQRCTPPVKGFLEGIRQITKEKKILLIFDEVVTGFRLAYGGAQEYYGVVPDIAAFGKAMGGGYPIGVVCGRADILDLCVESNLGKEGYVWFASTLAGNPVSVSASLATLKELRKPGAYERLHHLGRKLREKFRALFQKLEIPGQVLGDGPLCQVLFTEEPVTDYRAAFRADRQKGRRFALGLFEKGIFLNPMGTKMYLSLAHTEEDIQKLIDISRKVLKKI